MDKLEIKNINHYLVSSIIPVSNKIIRDIVSIQYEVDDKASFNRLEQDWRNFKKEEELVILAVSFLKKTQEVYFNDKPLRIKESNVKTRPDEEPKDETENVERK